MPLPARRRPRPNALPGGAAALPKCRNKRAKKFICPCFPPSFLPPSLTQSPDLSPFLWLRSRDDARFLRVFKQQLRRRPVDVHIPDDEWAAEL